MKLKEYTRLGKISIKSRKKSTKNTVRGISFGLIMLVPVVFFTLAFYIDLYGTIDSTKSVSSFYVTAEGNESESDGSSLSSGVVQGKTERALLERQLGDTVEEILYSEYYGIETWNANTVAVFDGTEKEIFREDGFNQTYDPTRINLNGQIRITEPGTTGDLVITEGLKNDLADKGKTLFAAGSGFSADAKGEVLLSETLLGKFGVSAENALGKEFSLRSSMSNGSVFLDNDNDPDNDFSLDNLPGGSDLPVTVIGNFKVAGVVSEDYYRLNSKTKNDAHIWLSGDSVYTETDGVRKTAYLPEVRYYEQTDDYGNKNSYCVATFSENVNAIAEKAAAAKMFFPAVPAVYFASMNSYYMYSVAPVATLFVQCADYRSAEKVAQILESGYQRIDNSDSTYTHEYQYGTETYSNFYMLNKVGGYMMLVLYIFGGIIFFATLLNLYNSVNYSVQARRNYIGMMRAIGAKQKVIPKLYFVEILLIFRKSVLWVLLFGGGLSFGIKMLIDYLFKESGAVFGAVIKLNFVYFFVALAVLLVLIFFIAFLFSRVACRPVTKKPILEVLSDDK